MHTPRPALPFTARRVTDAAAARRQYVALNSKEALKCLGGGLLRADSKQGGGGAGAAAKRKHPAAGSEYALGGDTIPHSMLLSSFMAPKVRRLGE